MDTGVFICILACQFVFQIFYNHMSDGSMRSAEATSVASRTRHLSSKKGRVLYGDAFLTYL